MTRDPVGRRGVGLADAIRRLDAATALTTILVLGLVLRVFIAGVYLPLSGFAIDVGDFTAWGQRLASLGPAHFYEAGYFSDYPPGYLYVLWALGGLGGLLAPLVGQDATGGLVKIPGILADIGVAWLLFAIARRWADALRAPARVGVSAETIGLVAATFYLFNPGVVFDSAVWGQIDSVGTLVLLVTIYALGRGWTELAGVGAVVAMLVKFQFAFLIPIVAIVGLKRHLLGRSSSVEHDGRRDPLRVLTSLAAGVAVLVAMLWPFGMTLLAPPPSGVAGCTLGPFTADPVTSLIGKFCEASHTYTGLSINAFNLWRNPWSGLGDTLHWGDDTVGALAVGATTLSWQTIGTILFGLVALVALWQVARRDDQRGVLLASLLLAVAFFVLPTRVHERYLFPALALAAPLLFAWRGWPWVAAGLSLNFFANVYWVYTEDWSFAAGTMNPGAHGQPMPQDPLLTATLLTDGGIWLLSALSVLLLGIVLWRSLRLSLTPPETAAEPSGARVVEPPPAPRFSGLGRRATAPPRTGGEPAWLAANPADAYLHEPMRRLDRRDALLLLGLVVFALVFRLWRLDIPRGHHFDEVYHARSAAEFLSDWENGWNRDVYEWTHPMLAKYLIAAGIVAVDPNKVVATEPMDRPVTALAVAPAREAFGRQRSIAFSATGGPTITAWDAVTGEELARFDADGPVATLVVDLDAPRLLVGRADAGTIEVYDLAAYLASPEGRGPPRTSTIDTDLAAVLQVVPPRGSGAETVVRGPDGIAVLAAGTDAVVASREGQYGGIGLLTGGDEAESGDTVVVTDLAGNRVVFLRATDLEPAEDDPLSIDATLIGPLLARGNGDDQQVVALTGPLAATHEHAATAGGLAAIDGDAGELTGLIPLPGTPALIGDQRVANLLYVAGTTADGQAEVWTIDPHVERRKTGTIGMAAFDATALPGTPLAMAFDIATTSQGDDHGRLLVSSGTQQGAGAITTIDAGSNAFAWRIAGVLFGAALVGLVYLLAATMFSRRRIAVLAAAFVAIDGMSYVMSRIAMNDIFVAVFIVAAYLVFWQVWSGRWARSAWWAMPLTGVLIGLAAASKWVGFYALAGLLVLVLARSALGRLLLVALAALAAVVGGIGAPWPFLVVMVGIVALALGITWLRPIRVPLGDALLAIPATTAVVAGIGLAFVMAFSSVEGREPRSAVEYLFGLLARGAQAQWPAWIMIGVGAALIGWRAWRSLRDPASDRRWFEPAEMGGFAWAWVGASLVIVPLVVYALAYIPYLQLGHDWAIGGGPGYGWSLDELHAQMFGYHFNLTAGHASSSPWWSWPLALKPTWFFGGTAYDRDQIAVIYNGGNPVLFWAGIPALVACAVLAWKRRSAALVLVVAAFAFQYVPWIRIERATFAYHYLTAVIFAMVAIAYLVDELLRRPAWRDLAIGYLALVVVAGILVFPLNSALAMPDWYVNAARSLPPWNYGFQFPNPPTGERAELVSTNALKLLGGLVAAVAAAVFAVAGRGWWERRRSDEPGPPAEAALDEPVS
jgi:predicted membrane-bound dolichyl-phosphate-mannose-protein mannosyltransferase